MAVPKNVLDDSPFKDVDASIGQVLLSDQCGSIFAYGSVKDFSYLSCRSFKESPLTLWM